MTYEAVMCGGFPTALESTVRHVLATLGAPAHQSRAGDEISLDDGRVAIPIRTYVEEPEGGLLASLTDVQLGVSRCLLARHHDGFVRQRQIDHLVELAEPWSTPYLLALVGEYVIEIHEALLDHLIPALDVDERVHDTIAGCLASNPAWWLLVQNRVVSYWAEYYRLRYPMERSKRGRRIPDAYPAAALVRRFSRLEGVGLQLTSLR